MNLNIKLPDLSKIESVKSGLVSKLSESDVGSSLKSKISNVANEYGGKIKDTMTGQLSGLANGFMSDFNMPSMDSVDIESLNIGNIDMNSQLQEYLNGFDINNL